MSGRHFASDAPLGGCRGSFIRLAALLAFVSVLFVVLVVASCAMAPRETNPPDTSVNECAEVNSGQPEGCE